MTRKSRRGYLYRRGAIWWLQYSVAGQVIRESLETTNKAEAEKRRFEKMRPLLAAEKADALAVIAARMDTAKLADEANPPLTLAQSWDAYVAAQNRNSPSARVLASYGSYVVELRAWLQEHHPNVAFLRDVTPEMAAGYFSALDARNLTSSSINKRMFLRTFFKVLAKPGRIPANPFEEIALRRRHCETKRPLTVEEIKRVIETAEGEMKTLFMIGTFTGLRLADCATLQWSETDLDRGIIRRIPRKTARTGQVVIVGIPGILGEHLARLPRQGPFVLPEIAEFHRTRLTALSFTIQAHLKRCGIQTVKEGTGPGTDKRGVSIAGFHSLRHSFISMHAQAGTPQAVLQKLVGHGNPIMTEHYTHISESTARATAAALPAIVGEGVPVKALPAARMVPAYEVRALAERLSAKNWAEIKAEMLAL